MFKGISFTDYLIYWTVILVIYYVFYVLVFYRGTAKQFLSARLNKGRHPDEPDSEDADWETDQYQPAETAHHSSAPVSSFAQATEDTFVQVEELIGKLKSGIAHAADSAYGREETSLIVGRILQGYPEIKGSAFQDSISELIVSECEKNGKIALGEDEVDALWESA